MKQVARLRLDITSFDDIKRKCMRWAEDYYEKVKYFDPDIPKGLHDRAADNWTPLLAVAVLSGWREKAEAAMTALSCVETSESIDAHLLGDIRNIFEKLSVDRLASQSLCDHLAAIDDRPWGEWSKGRAITTNKLSGRLKAFGIGSTTIRIPHEKTLKGYYLKSFKDAFDRYLPKSVSHNVTNVDSNQEFDTSKRHNDEGVTFQNNQSLGQTIDCYDVTFQNRKSIESKQGQSFEL